MLGRWIDGWMNGLKIKQMNREHPCSSSGKPRAMLGGAWGPRKVRKGKRHHVGERDLETNFTSWFCPVLCYNNNNNKYWGTVKCHPFIMNKF